MQNKDKIIRRSVLITAAAMVCLFVTHQRCSGKNCPGKSPEELPIEAPTYEIVEPAVTFETTSDCVTKTDREKWEK